MDSADIYDGSSTRRVRASEYTRFKYGYRNTYCPICGEPVNFASGPYQTAHFRHTRNSDIAKMCENYASNNSYSSGLSTSQFSQKVLGLPLYLELIGDTFQLYLGLQAKRLHYLISKSTDFLTIRDANYSEITKISAPDFSEDTTTFCPLNRIETKKYFVTASSSREKFALGLSERGTLFHIFSKYCPRVGHNAVIYVGTYYYLLVRKREFHNKPFLDLQNEYPIYTKGSSDWVVYEAAFTTISEEAFSYAKYVLRVSLTERKQAHLPLWPPMIQYDELDSESNKITTHFLKSPARVFYVTPHKKQKQEGIQFLDVLRNKRISGDTNMQPTEFSVDEMMHVLDYTKPSVEISLNGEHLSLEEEYFSLPKSERHLLNIQSDMKCTLSVTNDGNLKGIYQASLLHHLPDPEAGDTFSLYHGLDCITSFSFKREGRRKPGSVSDEELYTRLIKKEDVLIPFPMKLKYAMSMFENYPKTYLKLTMLLKSGKIGKSTAESLERIVRNGGEL